MHLGLATFLRRRMLVTPGESRLLAGGEALQGERELLPGLGIADLDLDVVGALLRMLGGAQRGDLDGHQVAARRRPLDRHPLRHLALQILDRLLDLHRPGLDLGIGKVEVLDVAQLDLRPGLHRGDEGQGLAGLEVGDLLDLRRQERLDGGLRLRLFPVAGQQPILDLLLDVLGEPATDQLGRHLALAEAGQADPFPEFADDALRLRFDGRRGHLHPELLAAGSHVFQR